MIVRVMGRGQFELGSVLLDEMNKIDNEIVRLLGKNDSEGFKRELNRLIELVLKNGKPVDSKLLVGSDIIIPPHDLTLEEARRVFKGGGLIPEHW